MTFVTSHIVLQHPILSALKNVQISTLSEFDKIRRVSYISRDDSNGEIRFVIQDLKKFQIFTEMTILPFFRKLEFSRVLQQQRRWAHPLSAGDRGVVVGVEVQGHQTRNQPHEGSSKRLSSGLHRRPGTKNRIPIHIRGAM